MEAIKCPNCGSEKCKELTEEKWACLACDNIFLIHNLSKEFRQTDSHITDVHRDISQKLEEIKSLAGNGSSEESQLKELLYDAEAELSDGDFLEAYQLFKKYSVMKPDSYVGYEGMFRSLTDNYEDDIRELYGYGDGDTINEILRPIYDGFDVLKKALQCEDCPKEDILNKTLAYYKRNTKSMIIGKNRVDLTFALYGDSVDFVNQLPDVNASDDEQDAFWSGYEDVMKENINSLSANLAKVIEDKKSEIVQNKANMEKMQGMGEKKKVFMSIKPYIPFCVCLVATIVSFAIQMPSFKPLIIFFMIIIRIFLIVADVLTLLVAVASAKKPSEQMGEYDNNVTNLEKNIQFLEETINVNNSIDAMGLGDIENLINNWNESYGAADNWYDFLLEDRQRIEAEEEEEAEQEAELSEGYFEVRVTNWGSNPKAVRDILIAHSSSEKFVKDRFKNKEQCTLTGWRKSQAYGLQEKLMNAGATAYVNKM